MEIPQDIKGRTGIWSSSSPSEYIYIYPKETKSLFLKDICIPIFIAVLFKIAKTWKQPKCPLIDELIKKMPHTHTHTHTHTGILFSHKEGNLAIFNSMRSGHYAKWNKSDREWQISIISLICEIPETHRNREQIDYQRQGMRGWGRWVKWSKGTKL